MVDSHTNSRDAHDNGDSKDAHAGSSGVAASADSASADEPPIRTAGSPHQLTEKSGGETRFVEQHTKHATVEHNYNNLTENAHSLPSDEVGQLLGVDLE